jgi:hypothetical protein
MLGIAMYVAIRILACGKRSPYRLPPSMLRGHLTVLGISGRRLGRLWLSSWEVTDRKELRTKAPCGTFFSFGIRRVPLESGQYHVIIGCRNTTLEATQDHTCVEFA